MVFLEVTGKNRLATFLDHLTINPIPSLLASRDPALVYHVRDELLGETVLPIESLWGLKPAVQIIERQSPEGFWPPQGPVLDSQSGCNYRLVETYRQLRLLVECYRFDCHQPALIQAAEYLFSCQTEEGDIRGILGNQLMPYYHGAMLGLLVKAGYTQDPRLIRGLEWLLGIRQEDGGWLIPAQTVPPPEKTSAFWLGQAYHAPREAPSSHIATGMALRAFTLHPLYRRHPDVLRAAGWLKGRFFLPDTYNDRRAAGYWLKFQYPFWWSNLLTALDSLSNLGFTPGDPQIARGLGWFADHQTQDGLWDTGYDKGKLAQAQRPWVGLAVCRIFQRFFA